MTGEPLPRALARLVGPQPAPLRRLHRARRDRGAVPRRGRRPRRSSSSATCGCRPGETVRRRRLRVTYRERHGRARRRPRRHRRADLVRRRARRAQGRRALHAAPVAQLLPDPGPARWARSRASSRARPPARSTCAGACARDLWLAVRPDLGRARAADRARPTAEFADSRGDVQALRRSPRWPSATAATRRRPPSARSSRRSWSWIWIGGGDRRARRAGRGSGPRPRRACAGCASLYAARLGRELSRA